VVESSVPGRWYAAYENGTDHPNLIGTGHEKKAEAEAEAAGLRRWEIIAGARRYKAAKLAKQREVPCRIVRVSNQEARDIQIIENLQRADIHPLDEAEAFVQLLGSSGDIKALAKRVAKSELYVRRRLSLHELIEPAKKAFREHRMFPGHAYQLSRFPAAAQRAIWKQLEGKDVTPNQLRKAIADNFTLKLSGAPFDTGDAKLLEVAGSCTDCPKRTGNNPLLFSDIKLADTCTDRDCYSRKVEAHLVQIATKLEKASGKPVLRLSEKFQPTIKGALSSGQWHRCDRASECAHAQQGIIVETDYYGSGPKKLGQTITVCATKECKFHFGAHTGESAETMQERERTKRRAVKQKVEINKAVFAAVQEKMPGVLGVEELRLIGRELFQRVYGPYRNRIARDVYQLEPKIVKSHYVTTGGTTKDYAAALLAKLPEMNAKELTRFCLIALTAANAYTPPLYTNSSSDPDNPLYTLAKLYKVDAHALREKIVTADREKAKAKKATKAAKAA